MIVAKFMLQVPCRNGKSWLVGLITPYLSQQVMERFTIFAPCLELMQYTEISMFQERSYSLIIQDWLVLIMLKISTILHTGLQRVSKDQDSTMHSPQQLLLAIILNGGDSMKQWGNNKTISFNLLKDIPRAFKGNLAAFQEYWDQLNIFMEMVQLYSEQMKVIRS